MPLDTTKWSYPLTDELLERLKSRAHRLASFSPDGLVIWDKHYVCDSLPSSFSGLRVSWQLKSDFVDKLFIKGVEDLAFFEFSLCKWLSPHGYNSVNYSIEYDIQGLYRWINGISEVLGMCLCPLLFRPKRLDFAQNYTLTGDIKLYMRSLELKMSQYQDADTKLSRYGSGVKYQSSWVGKKIYHKYQEWWDVERPKHKFYKDLYKFEAQNHFVLNDFATVNEINGKRYMTLAEVMAMSNMIRYESEFKGPFLRRAGIKFIHDIPKLLPRFNSDKLKYMSACKINPDVCLTPTQIGVIELVKRLGVQAGKSEFMRTRTSRYWFKLRNQLIAKGIHLESLDNPEYRLRRGALDAEFTEDYELVELPMAA